MALITASDFTGIYKISQQSFTTVELAAYINQMESAYLVELFGAELYALFIADLASGVPQSARFLAIYNAFVESSSQGDSLPFYVGSPFNPYFPDGEPEKAPKNYQSFGIKDMLTGFIYFDFQNGEMMKASPTGLSVPENDVSKRGSAASFSNRLSMAYNRAVDSYNAIYWYCKSSDYKDDYPEFDGTRKQKIFMGGAI